MTTPRVLLYVQNLLGIGHLRRAAAVARGLVAEGLAVDFVSGGMPVPHLPLGGAELVQLPPVRTADDSFKVLLDEHDRPIDDAFRNDRRDRLLALLAERRPAAVITELFPFGRRQMRFELLPLLEAARAAAWKPVVLSSMRDILVTKPRMDRNREIVDTLNAWYDGALIHADPELIRLERTFPMAEEIRVPLTYTGYVVNADDLILPDADPLADGEVLVSAGGGAVGHDFMRRVADAMPALPLADRTWRFVTGHHMRDDALDHLRSLANRRPNMVVETMRPDLPALMAGAALSVSQAGYNTLLELMAVRARAVVVPFEGGIETEQRLRADLLAEAGALEVVTEPELGPATLAAAIDRALARPRHAVPSVALDGARATGALVARLVRERAAA